MQLQTALIPIVAVKSDTNVSTNRAAMGLMWAANAAATNLSIVAPDGTTVTLIDGVLSKGVVYPIASIRVNVTGSSTDTLLLFTAGGALP